LTVQQLAGLEQKIVTKILALGHEDASELTVANIDHILKVLQ
jgi:hypothetical protein